jgi:hypothetical protein
MLESFTLEVGIPGCVAWRATQYEKEDERLHAYHAWIAKDLEVDGIERVRVLTQGSLIGRLAAYLGNRETESNVEWA